MSRRRVLAWGTVYALSGLAVLGFLAFVVGVVLEFFSTRTRPITPDLSPAIQIALLGLGVTALTMTLGFILVGILLARQTRLQAPGYGEAYHFFEQMQFNQAIQVLERAVREGRETPDVLMLLSSAYAFAGQLAKAQATADRAVQLFPTDASAYVTLANGYRLQASYAEAADALERAVALAPDQPLIWAELGFLHVMAGEQAAAIEAFERAAAAPLPSMYAVRVFYHLAEHYQQQGSSEQAAHAHAQLLRYQAGLESWRPVQAALSGTAYGQFLRYEIMRIEQALKQHEV